MTLRGIARGSVIELEEMTGLPEGTAVEVEIKEATSVAPTRRISPAELADAMRNAPWVDPEEVAELLRFIKENRQPADFSGIFDGAER